VGRQTHRWHPLLRCGGILDDAVKDRDESGNYRSLLLLLGVGGLRWGEAIALRVCDVDFLRRRIELHRNAVYVCDGFAVGSLKSNKNRAVVLPAFVIDAIAATAAGKGRNRSAVALSGGRRLSRDAVAVAFVAGRCGAPLPESRPVLPAGDSARAAPYGSIVGHLGGRESEGGPAHARPCQRGDDAQRVRRFVRLRLEQSCGKYGQNVVTAGVTAHFPALKHF
jgi:hypothetical protein